MTLTKLINQFVCSEDATRIRKLKNKYAGQRCFVIGTGPSLNKTNLSLLKSEYTFAVNSFIPDGIKKFGIKPSFYAMSDRKVMDKTIGTFSENIPEHTLCLFPLEKKRKVTSYIKKNCDKIYYINDYDGLHVQDGHFSTKADRILYHAGTVVVDYCIPVAIYMGFEQIYLVGCDCTHKKGIHFDGSPPMEAKVIKWNRSFKAFEVVKKFADKHSIIIKNATVRGDLEVFERIKLEDLFKK